MGFCFSNMLIQDLYQVFLKHPVVCTDSRKSIKDAVFFALKGTSFNGNTYAREALDKGCAYAVVDDPSIACDERYLLVKDGLEALQQLARLHRSNHPIPVLAITGSNGKTTTKELIHAILSKKYQTIATPGNLNNHIGVPLTLLSITGQTEIAVVEMGANHPGEISLLCQIALPDLGIITNIGRAHLEGFGSFEGVIHAKNELYISVRERGGTLFVNADNAFLMHLSESISRVTYAINSTASVMGSCISAIPFLKARIADAEQEKVYPVSSQLTGVYNLENMLAAFTVGRYFHVDADRIIQAIEGYRPGNMRSQLTETTYNRVIVDAYNANPSSMEAALINFAGLPDPDKWLVLGDMLELGDETMREHRIIMDLAIRLNLKKGLLIGEHFSLVDVPPGFLTFPDVEKARVFLEMNPIRGGMVLLKGSRAMGLEKLIGIL